MLNANKKVFDPSMLVFKKMRGRFCIINLLVIQRNFLSFYKKIFIERLPNRDISAIKFIILCCTCTLSGVSMRKKNLNCVLVIYPNNTRIVVAINLFFFFSGPDPGI